MKSELPLLSIFCITYNHAPYIKDAIEGFLQQKTNFPVEIVIHDDASTDGTDNIIKEYEKKYPELIIPIYEKENQYSQGVRINRDIMMPKIRGKYMAICEGDDYWTNPNKLQKQVDYLEQHEECSAVVHRSNVLYNEKFIFSRTCFNGEKDFDAEEIILGGGAFVSTASIVCRTEYARKFPSYRLMTNTGDYSLMVLLASKGKVHYFPEVMSNYRFQVPGSWTYNVLNDKKFEKDHMLSFVLWYIAANNDTMRKYENAFRPGFEYYLTWLCRRKFISIEDALTYLEDFESGGDVRDIIL